VHRAVDVRRERAREVVLAEPQEQPVDRDARVGHGDAHGAAARHEAVDGLEHGLAVAHVERDELAVAARGAHEREGLFGGGGVLGVVDGHPRAAAREGDGDGAAEAPRCARHDGGLALEVKHHSLGGRDQEGGSRRGEKPERAVVGQDSVSTAGEAVLSMIGSPA
jgi:hypothetical protein